MGKENTAKDGNIIDFSKVREAKVEEKRRRYERLIFENTLGVYCESDSENLVAVELVDVSKEGISFQLPESSKNNAHLENKKNFPIRLYFSKDSYLILDAQIVNKRPCIENGRSYFRYGCAITTESHSYQTFKSFVEFLSHYAETALQDSGRLKVCYF